jgi:hypothetical protein
MVIVFNANFNDISKKTLILALKNSIAKKWEKFQMNSIVI